MARNTPRVDGTVLVDRNGAAPSIAVGSPAWYAWLEQATTFAFASAAGSFTARKERSGAAGWYWKAYRKRAGRLHRAYLGKSADLSLDRLATIAADLAQRAAGQPATEAGIAIGSAASAAHGESLPAATSAPPLLSTKLYIPVLRPQLVSRPRLVERVQAGLRGKLTLISAPAGFGKSTLLAECLASRSFEFRVPSGRLSSEFVQSPQLKTQNSKLLVAWVSLDVEDNDATRFWSYVIAALEQVYPPMDSTAKALLRSPQLPAIEAILTSLINAISPMDADVALVLDDYHLIATPAIHAALAFLIDHLPPQLHLVVLTRADPPLPLTRLRMRGELAELRAADLRFTAGEAAAFLTATMGLSLTSDEVAALEARTEGWIAGLQLAALAMQNHADQAGFVAAFSGSNRFVVDYLVEEVLTRLPAHLQHFVLQTAILDRLCGPLCDALLGLAIDQEDVDLAVVSRQSSVVDSYSQLILNELDRQNLFLIPLDDERRWYRYHHLFADVLRARLRSGATAREAAALLQRASAWHEREGLIEEAVRYAFLIEDAAQAVTLIERYGMDVMLTSSDVLLVQSWVAQVPRALILARPRLALSAGFAMALAGQFAAVERLVADAAPAFGAPDLHPNIAGELALLRAMIARVQDDTAGTLALAQQALAKLDPDNHRFRAGAALYLGVAYMWRGELAAAKQWLANAAALGELGSSQWIALAALEELASLQARHGQLREMRETAAQAAQLSARVGGQRLPAAGMGHVASAEVAYEWNDLAGAARAATQAIELLRGSVERLLLVRGYVVLALVCQARGEIAGALDSIRRGEEWFAQTPIAATGLARAWLAAYRARLWVRQGNLRAADQWAQECIFAGDSQLGYVQRLALVRLRLTQARNDPGGQLLGEASAILAQLLPAVEARGWMRYQLEILMLQALVCQAQADHVGAGVALEHALALAEPQGFVRSFVDEGAPMRLLIADCRLQVAQRVRGAASRAGHRLTYMDTLLVAFGDGDVARTEPASQPAISNLQSATMEPLTARELEILRLIGDGHSNQAIADRLVVAVSTIKKHVNNIYGKLDVRSRTQALVRARELSLL